MLKKNMKNQSKKNKNNKKLNSNKRKMKNNQSKPKILKELFHYFLLMKIKKVVLSSMMFNNWPNKYFPNQKSKNINQLTKSMNPRH